MYNIVRVLAICPSKTRVLWAPRPYVIPPLIPDGGCGATTMVGREENGLQPGLPTKSEETALLKMLCSCCAAHGYPSKVHNILKSEEHVCPTLHRLI